jgi:hypothetical protein
MLIDSQPAKRKSNNGLGDTQSGYKKDDKTTLNAISNGIVNKNEKK